MKLIKKVLSFFGLQFIPSPVTSPKPLAIISPEESVDLYSKINIKKLEDIEKAVLLSALAIERIALEVKQDREFLVHIATLHEELLHQLDQGKVVMLRQGGGMDLSSSEDDLLDDGPASPQHMLSGKKKYDIN